jgi:hypothetical protein
MFLHDLPRPLIQKSTIFLHPILRAPLGIVPGRRLYAALRSTNAWNVPEIILTPYRYEIWPDIWNLELRLVDAPGQLERLLRILERSSISVLHEVARTAYKSRYHSKYLMLDCSAYDSSEVDKRPSYRLKEPHNRLNGLYYNILIEFMHEIRINYDNTPRLRLFRNILHLNMWEDTSQRLPNSPNAILDMPEPLTYEKKGLVLSDRLRERLAISGTSYCVASTNLKSHAIYCAIHDITDSNIVHMMFYFRPQAVSHSKIMGILRDHNLNIVRSQLAQGILGRASECPPWLFASDGFYTLNVLAHSNVPIRKTELVDQFNRQSFAEDVKNEAFFAHVLDPMRFKVQEGWLKWPIGSKI